MAKEENKNLITTLLSGWQRIFGGEKQSTRQSLPFPANHFYTPQELEFLSDNRANNPIDQWAVSVGKWAFEQSKDKSSPSKYAPVKWQDGLLSTWIDGKLFPDPKERQIDRLLLLKEQGYNIPKNHEKAIRDYEARNLIGKFFVANEGGETIKVKAYDEGRLITETPSLTIQKWEADKDSYKEEKVDYEDFKSSLETNYAIMPEEQRKHFQEKLLKQQEGAQLYKGVQALLHQSYPPTFGGSFPMELRNIHEVDILNGKVIPVSWSLSDKNEIRVSVYSKGDNTPRNISINPNNAYKAESLLRSISSIIERDKVQGLTRSLVNVLGNNFGDGKIFARSNNSYLLAAKQGNVNAVVSTSDGRLLPFDLNTHQEIPLDKEESAGLMRVLLFEGQHEQTLLRSELSVPLMKEYVASLADKSNVMSGDFELLPSGSRVESCCNAYYKAEEELHSLSHSSFPLSQEDKAEIMASHKAAYQDFKQELETMVRLYNSHPKEIDSAKLKKVEELEHIIKFEAKGQTIAKPVDDGVGHASLEDVLENVTKIQKEMGKAVEVMNNNSSTTEEYIQSLERVNEACKPLIDDSSQSEANTNEHYVSAEEVNKGRWHSPEVRQREAYQRYGELMADKLSLQLTYGNMPWIKNGKQLPHDLNKKPYQGTASLMLALETEKKGYTLPIYISRDDVVANNLLVKQDASPFPLIEGEGVKDVYNIDQTNFAVQRSKEYEDLKVEAATQRGNQNNNALPSLLNRGAWQSTISLDGKPSLASYSANEDTIHLAPAEKYENQNDYFRDMGMGLIRSCRKEAARKTNYENLIKEEFVSLVGSVMLGQRNHYEVTTPQQSAMWKERLRQDPNYAKKVLTSANDASQIVMQRIDTVRKGDYQSLDLRSTTPVEIDVDGNGVVESQENLAPDKKQGSGEGKEASDDVPRQEKKSMHR